MSWRLLVRLIPVAVAGGAAVWRRRRRGRPAAGATGRGRRGAWARRMAGLRRDAAIAGRAASLAAFLAAAAVLATAGTSSTLLSPRWLGILLLCLAAGALAVAIREGINLRRAVNLRRLERRDDAINREL